MSRASLATICLIAGFAAALVTHHALELLGDQHPELPDRRPAAACFAGGQPGDPPNWPVVRSR